VGAAVIPSDLRQRPVVAVIGPGACDTETAQLAFDVGHGLATAGAVVVCGGLGGCMEAAARGARQAGGLAVGFLPDADARRASPALGLAFPTGLGEGRNLVVVASARVVVAIAGGAGTLSEIGFALKLGRPVIGLGTWQVRDAAGAAAAVQPARDAAHAVALALAAAGNERVG
jgi:uncharacterized protein (TIGR00725 family)